MVKLTFGVKGLDKILKNALQPGSLVVIAGHPGSGKTTFATTICYKNAVHGKKCLYISVQEPWEKFVDYMDLVGVPVKELSDTSWFKYLKLPQVAGKGGIDVIEFINSNIEEFNPDIVVVDSISPILKTLSSNAEARSILQNYFYEVAVRKNAVFILIAEIPITDIAFNIGDLEFVADTIIFLRHRVKRSRLVREIEIRKARGSSINIAKIPFTIIRGEGIEIWPPPMLEEIPGAKPDRRYRLACSVLDKYVSRLYGGMSIYITYPPDFRPPFLISAILAFIATNKTKTLIFTYSLPPATFYQVVNELFGEKCSNNIGNIIEKYLIDVIGFNTSAISVEELYYKELSLIEEKSPDTVVFLGVDALPIHGEYGDLLKNKLLLLRKKGILVIRGGPFMDVKSYRFNARLSDVVVRFMRRKPRKTGYLENYIYVWSVGNQKPLILGPSEASKCINDIYTVICSEKQNTS